MNTQDKYERLKQAYAIIDGIPEGNFDLNDIITRRGNTLGCGTIACAMGWLGMHPTFMRKEYEIIDRGDRIYWYKRKTKDTSEVTCSLFYEVAADLFNLTHKEACDMFGSSFRKSLPNSFEFYGQDSEKKIWQTRVEDFLRQKQAL
jgi:hypothetical protein